MHALHFALARSLFSSGGFDCTSLDSFRKRKLGYLFPWLFQCHQREVYSSLVERSATKTYHGWKMVNRFHLFSHRNGQPAIIDHPWFIAYIHSHATIRGRHIDHIMMIDSPFKGLVNALYLRLNIGYHLSDMGLAARGIDETSSEAWAFFYIRFGRLQIVSCTFVGLSSSTQIAPQRQRPILLASVETWALWRAVIMLTTQPPDAPRIED